MERIGRPEGEAGGLHRSGVQQAWGTCSLRTQRRLGGRSQAGRGTQDACPRDSWALISQRMYPLWARSGWMRDHQHRFETALVGGVQEQTPGRPGGRMQQADALTTPPP